MTKSDEVFSLQAVYEAVRDLDALDLAGRQGLYVGEVPAASGSDSALGGTSPGGVEVGAVEDEAVLLVLTVRHDDLWQEAEDRRGECEEQT